MDEDEFKERLLKDTQSDTPDGEYPSKARQVAMISIVLFLMLMSLSADTMIFPFFPAIAVEKGLSSTEMGVIFASFDFAKFIASPIFGSLLIRWHPKSMCAVGNVMTALACIGFGLVNFEGNGKIFTGICVLIRLTAGVGSAMLSVAATSILMKSTSFEPSTIAGIIETTIGLGFAVGPVFGAAFYELAGYTPMFCILGGMMLIFLPVYAVMVPNVVEVETKAKRGFISLLAIPGCLLVFVHCAMIRVTTTSRSTQISAFMATSFGTSASVVGIVFAFAAVSYAMASVVTTRIVQKRYTFHMMITGWCMTIVILMFFGPSPLLDFIFHGHRYFWLTVTMFVASTIAQSCLFVPPYQAALGLAEVNGYKSDSLHTYGMIAGLLNCGFSFGCYVGPVIAGAITDALNFPWTQTIINFADLTLMVVMVIYLVYMKCTKQPLYASADNMEEDVEKLTAEEAVEEKINAACADRMNKCLNNSKMLTEVYQQQPLQE